MASPPRPIPGLSRRRQTYFLTVVKPVDLRAGPGDRYAYRATLGTRDESVARIKAMAIRADLEAQWQAERGRRRPQPAIAPTVAIVDMLVPACACTRTHGSLGHSAACCAVARPRMSRSCFKYQPAYARRVPNAVTGFRRSAKRQTWPTRKGPLGTRPEGIRCILGMYPAPPSSFRASCSSSTTGNGTYRRRRRLDC